MDFKWQAQYFFTLTQRRMADSLCQTTRLSLGALLPPLLILHIKICYERGFLNCHRLHCKTSSVSTYFIRYPNTRVVRSCKYFGGKSHCICGVKNILVDLTSSLEALGNMLDLRAFRMSILVSIQDPLSSLFYFV